MMSPAEIGYSTRVREIAGNLSVSLLKDAVTVHASDGEFRPDRAILLRQPQGFEIVPTAQRERGHTAEGGSHGQVSPSTGPTSGWRTRGSIPFTVNRTRGRAEYFFTPNVGLENRYGVFVHGRP